MQTRLLSTLLLLSVCSVLKAERPQYYDQHVERQTQLLARKLPTGYESPPPRLGPIERITDVGVEPIEEYAQNPNPNPNPPPTEPTAELTYSVVADDVIQFDGSKSTGGTLFWTAIPPDMVFVVADGKQTALSVQTNPNDQYCTVALVVSNGSQYSVKVMTVLLPVVGPTPGPTPTPPTPVPPPAPPIPTAANPFVVLVTDNANESTLPPTQQTLVENREFWINSLPGQWRTVDIGDSNSASFKPWLALKKISAPALVFMDTTKTPVAVLGVEPVPLTGVGLVPLVLKYTTPTKTKK